MGEFAERGHRSSLKMSKGGYVVFFLLFKAVSIYECVECFIFYSAVKCLSYYLTL